MKAAAHFVFGTDDDRIVFEPGDEVPDVIAEQVPEHLLLEKLARQNPESMSREQLMILAGLVGDQEEEQEAPSMTEEDVREALSEFRTKADLLEWFAEIRPESDLVDATMTRNEIEDAIVEELTGE